MLSGSPVDVLPGTLTVWLNPRATYGAATVAAVDELFEVKVLLKSVPALVPSPARACVSVSVKAAVPVPSSVAV